MATFPRLELRIAALAALFLLSVGCGGQRPPAKDMDTEITNRIGTARALVNAGRYNDALQTLQKAIDVRPDDARLRNYFGQIAFLGGRLREAEGAFQKALQLDPYLTDAHNNLGAVYDREGRKHEAEQEYRTALADAGYPTPEKVYLNLGLLYLSQNRTEEAMHELRRAVEISPKFYRAHYELAGLLDRTGKLEEAIREYEVAAPGYRANGEYHFRLGLAYYRQGDRSQAQEHLRRVLEVSPGSENAARAGELLDTMGGSS